MANLFRRTPRLTLADMVSKGGVSQLVADDFFEASSGPVYDAILRRWNGTAWVKASLQRWTGSTWTNAVLRFWTGSAWGLVDTTGT
jgi:hypothetical protein